MHESDVLPGKTEDVTPFSLRASTVDEESATLITS